MYKKCKKCTIERAEREEIYMENQLLQEAKAMQEQLSQWRRQFHKNPELGFELPQTNAFIKEQLTQMGITYKEYEDISCITALLGDTEKEGGKCFLLRSDTDALPIVEESGEPFASENGNMHACGHDLHAAVLLGAAKLLKDHESELNGTVKLLFQSAEETLRGAEVAVKAGVLEDPHVDVAFAMHVASIMANNVIIYGQYPMSSMYGFRITLTGKGAHGSTPHLGVDPINTGVHLHLALQELIAREVEAADEAVITIGHFEGGAVSNVIPERAVLEGSLRTFKAETRERLIRRIAEVTESVAKTYRTQSEIEVLCDVPAVSCDTQLNEEIASSIKDLTEDVGVYPVYHWMGSEDFAFISQQVPSSYFGLGAGLPDKSEWIGQHNPKVRFTEECLSLGAAAYAKAAMDWLRNHG